MKLGFWGVRKQLRPLAALTLLVFVAAIPAAGQMPGRVVAVGDVHGNLDGFVQILQQARLVDASRNWVGGNATLVQTGDSIDRGPDMRPVLDLLMVLEKQAQKKGGRVVALLGNHEAMNMYGDLRYVSPANYASFADGGSEKRREKAWKDYVEWRKQRAIARKQPPPEVGGEMHQQWMEAHPPGFLEHREAFAPNGKYGKWLREHPAVLRLGDTIFAHGGISAELGSWKVEDLNKRIQSELRGFDSFRDSFSEQGFILPSFTLDEMAAAMTTELNVRKQEIEQKTQDAVAAGKTYQPAADEKKNIEVMESFLAFPNWFSVHPAGPLWFRGYNSWTDADAAGNLEKLAPLGAAHFVVGHSPQLEGQIKMRFDGRIFLIDTGMLTSYFKGGVGSALEIEGGKFTAIYPDHRTALLETPAATKARSGQTDNPEEFFREGADADLGGGTKPHLQGTVQAPASKSGGTNGSSSAPLPRVSPLPPRALLGPTGAPLPFKSDEEIMEFLRTARVVSITAIGEGINHPHKVLLEKDGVQMNAVFRDVDVDKDMARLADGRREMNFRDSYVFEIAAYRLSKLLGLDNVPPVVKRSINGTSGSLQIWIEHAMTETKRQKEKIRPPDVTQWNRQVQTMHAFDVLVYNDDRNMGNVLIDPNWKLWMIDHTRAFRKIEELKSPERLILVSRDFYKALRALTPDMVKAALKDSTRTHEISALLVRREKLLQYFDKLVSEKGEDNVFFTWEPRSP